MEILSQFQKLHLFRKMIRYSGAETSAWNLRRDQKGTSAVQGLKFMEKKDQQSGRNETAILIAAKMGVAEMVKKILDTFPEAMQDMDSEKKNLVLLAVENRQTSIYKLLLDWKILR
ncbi:hypothetical protein AB3S75_047163 [Citrus x aurantiifolia]